MAKSQINNQFYNLVQSLFKFIIIIYKFYRPYIKVLALSFIAYVAYRIGRMTVTDPLEIATHKLSNHLQNRVQFTIYLPEKIKKASQISKMLKLVLIISACFYFGLKFLKLKMMKKITIKMAMMIGSTLLIIILSIQIYLFILRMIQRRGRQYEMSLNQRLYSLTKQLGEKISGLLKIFLCKEKIIRHKSPPRGVCYKEDCKTHRQILKERSESIEFLVSSALSFSWCTVCRKRLSFDQFLNYQPTIFPNNESSNEEEQVNLRNLYLLSQLQRMIQWIKDVCPCNCSKIYWQESIRYIKNYKRKQKQIDEQLSIYQTKQLMKH